MARRRLLTGDERRRLFGLCCKHLGSPNDTAPFWGSGSIGEMLIEHVHGLGHGRGANTK